MGTTPPMTAVEIIKQVGNKVTHTDLPRAIKRLCMEKGWKEDDVRTLARAGAFGHIFQLFLNRDTSAGGALNSAMVPVYNFIGQTLGNYQPMVCEEYRGNHEQNRRVDSAIIGNSSVTHVFRGAASSFQIPAISTLIPPNVRSIPIAVVGYGAAGIILVAALKKLGFTSITIYEKSEESLGLWKQKNVYGRSRNNPRTLDVLGQRLNAAPGGGDEVNAFLSELGTSLPTREEIVAIKPGDLNHTLVFERPQAALPNIPPTEGVSQSRSFPIVINCMGIGKPVPPSDHERMTTTSFGTDIGPRWQQELTREHMNNKKLTFIGLGNSTAEMIRQVHAAMDTSDVRCDYRILTHYPKDAIWNPDSYVDYGGKKYRVFRDLSVPNLTKFHGDLPEFREDYFRALREGKIISDVRAWSRVGSGQHSDTGKVKVYVRNRKAKKRDLIEFDDNKAWTLIGYRHSSDDMISMGCMYDFDNRCALYDFDGEFTKNKYMTLEGATDPSIRVSRGYFGFGAYLTAPHNPNAMVIPGMAFRLGDLLMGIILRATEKARLNAG
jgi:hypothetical protein